MGLGVTPLAGLGEPPDTRSVGDLGRKGGRRWWGKGEIGGLIRVHLWEVIPRALRIWGFGFRSACFC